MHIIYIPHLITFETDINHLLHQSYRNWLPEHHTLRPPGFQHYLVLLNVCVVIFWTIQHHWTYHCSFQLIRPTSGHNSRILLHISCHIAVSSNHSVLTFSDNFQPFSWFQSFTTFMGHYITLAGYQWVVSTHLTHIQALTLSDHFQLCYIFSILMFWLVSLCYYPLDSLSDPLEDISNTILTSLTFN